MSDGVISDIGPSSQEEEEDHQAGQIREVRFLGRLWLINSVIAEKCSIELKKQALATKISFGPGF